MISVIKCLLLTTIIASTACSVYGLQCFNCDSSRDNRCGEVFDAQDEFKVDCDRLLQQQPQLTAHYGPFYKPNATSCVKRTYQYFPGKSRIERTCFYGGPKDNCNVMSESNSPSLKSTSCEKCTENLCNNSNALTPISLIIALFVFLIHFF